MNAVLRYSTVSGLQLDGESCAHRLQALWYFPHRHISVLAKRTYDLAKTRGLIRSA